MGSNDLKYIQSQQLDDILDDQVDTFALEQDPSWSIKNMDDAVWADNQIRNKELSIAETEKIRDVNIAKYMDKIERLKKWAESSTKGDRGSIEHFTNHLHLFHRRLIKSEQQVNEILVADNKKPKKLTTLIKLPYRNLTYKIPNPEILINGKKTSEAKNDPMLLSFVKDNNPEFVKVTEEVMWADFKDTLIMREVNGKKLYVNADGQSIDFIELKDREAVFDWKYPKED